LHGKIDLVMTQSHNMHMKKITTHYAKTHLSRLLKEVQQGEQIIILNGQTPVGRLVAVTPHINVRPAVGTVTSKPISCAEDAFAPMDDASLKEWGL
jgi:antitoxin (DNA-binding transcriptional repressor) of toxin-antitoxin stability system